MKIDESIEWLLRSGKLTLPQAALLIAELNPLICSFYDERRPEEDDIYEVGCLVESSKIALFRIAYKEMIKAGKEGELKIEWFYDRAVMANGPVVAYSSVSLDDLREWLLSCGKRPKLLFPEVDSHEMKDQKYAFQDDKHPRYAPKLAAVVAAWEAVKEAAPNKTVKQTLEKWLQEHASQYNLLDKKTGEAKKIIAELASVANWEPEGGAPKTTAAAPLSEEKDAKKSDNSVSSRAVVD
ncbi:hypothetical protein MCO_00614 [Bartonella sp. DB5-6]|uniref:hypothetical protein n=1 Tax=Bartonella sp. DB5-6 TaxID=1094755 RepID=UPI00026E9162|nr:hypothetical protein [Bartonella sp. DB5-6]EJF78587.1 hypothetical protein MCO_00614 [Bartonella sp. DB5-6]